MAFKNDKAVLYQFNKDVFTFGDLKTLLSENFKNADKLTKEQWSAFLDSKRGNDVFAVYSRDFVKKPEIKEQLLKTQQNLLADFLFSEWIEKELTNKPELLDDYFKKINKNIFGKKEQMQE